MAASPFSFRRSGAAGAVLTASAAARRPRPPGSRLLPLALRLLPARAVAEVLEPAVADLQAEWVAARGEGRRLQPAWIRLRGYLMLATTLGALAMTAARRESPAEEETAEVAGDAGDEAPQEPALPAGTDYLSEWDRVHATITTHAAECRRIAGWAELKAGGRVLDMACGTGQHLREFALRGHPCLGVDQLWWKLSRAARQTGEMGLRIPFVCTDFRSLRLPARFDLVLCLYAMSMMRRDADLLAALTAARESLSPGGRFAFNVLAGQGRDGGISSTFQDDHLRSYTADEVAGFLERVGLVPCRMETTRIPGFDSTDLFYVCRRQEAP